jgi:hypothetical protein
MEARKQRRSMVQEVIIILEKNPSSRTIPFPDPIEGNKPVDQKILTQAIKEARE